MIVTMYIQIITNIFQYALWLFWPEILFLFLIFAFKGADGKQGRYAITHKFGTRKYIIYIIVCMEL